MKKSKKPATPVELTDFFETMPMAMNDSAWRGGHFVYRDDAVMDHYHEKQRDTTNTIEKEIKTTAIITLVLVLITAVALSLFIWRGLNTIKGNVNQITDTTSYEL